MIVTERKHRIQREKAFSREEEARQSTMEKFKSVKDKLKNLVDNGNGVRLKVAMEQEINSHIK